MTNLNNLKRNANALTATLLKFALEYMRQYNTTALKAFTRIANQLYDFSKGHNRTAAARHDYTDRIFKVISESSLSFSDSELNTIYLYFGGVSISVDTEIKTFEKQLKAEISEQNAYRQKLIDETAEQRKLAGHSPLMLNEDIMQYIEYWNTFKNEQYLLYNNLYVLGYIAGKRAERVRKKSRI